MAFSDFIKKVKILLQGDPKDESGYDDYREESGATEEFYPAERSSNRDGSSASRLAQRMANEYYDDEQDDGYDDEQDYDYEDSNSYEYEDDAPVKIYGGTGGNYSYEQDDEQDDGFGSNDSYEEKPEEEPQPEEAPLPTRTEVTLMEIKRLSEKLDDETLRTYQMRLIQIKKETGAVSALTALRVLHEYVDDDDDAEQDDSAVFPDLSVK